ncbi:enoyl-CoA hydratase-related protein [Maritimibacter sp. DP1N21-5]|uniref:enoyl-CoA hydratase-related protein n=1 Tax=Maritimibacter sp. DP1N21-5 TaxID=2836867 RepID=UPI001C44E275|nr:enoyl-CoA hydratase-related protein [Maritimibacter sp. DP1N21-5]MBV7409575.1 enoyl-CoA hydratase/isomerase family protein [Maritimibacter sp. DP1N21-5]
MDYQTILYETGGGIAVITLDRPDKMNALNSQMRAEIADAVLRAAREARVIVLTGAGRAFCTGQDLGDSGSAGAADFERVLRDEYEPMIRAIVEAKVPVIAAVNGPAAGAGANLALACDVVIATESAYFLQAFSKIGLLPDAGGTFTLPRRIGMARAMGAALFADRVSAMQAADWGLIWEAVPDADFEAQWRGRAEHLAKGPTVAYGAIKEALRASMGNTFDEQLSLEAKLQGRCGVTRDFKEGVLAFLEKRPANYEGR